MAMADESDVPNSEIPARSSGASLVIRPGDFLLIEEHTAAADLYLEGVALESAELGGTINARLKLAGKIVKVTAVERGKAALARRGEDQ
jgi:flagella basal body P-ring formation protein FlgA